MGKRFTYTRINAKPLKADFDVDTKKVLESTKRVLHREIKTELEQETFSPAAKKALTKAIQIKIKPNSLQVTVNHPAFLPLVDGQTTEQMTWLTKARRPIPIITDSGKMIFRSATAKSMQDGKWQHPGRAPSTFIERARKITREHIIERVRKEATKSAKRAFAKVGGA